MLKGESEVVLNSKGWYTPGDKLQQHVATTRWSDKWLRGRGEFLWKSLSLQQNLSPQQVAQIQSDVIFCDLLQRQNSFAETKIFTKILQYTRSDLSLRRVAATCCCNKSPILYTWSYLVTATCCCNLSPSVYRPLDHGDYENKIFSTLTSAHALTSVILAGKLHSRPHSTTGFSENVLDLLVT